MGPILVSAAVALSAGAVSLSNTTLPAAPQSRAAAVDETREPSLKLTLLIGDRSVPLELDKPQKLEGEFRNPVVRVKAAPTRTFSYGGIAFDYPSSFTWEADIEGPNYRNWTMSGNDSKIMYFVLQAPFTPQLYAEGVAEEFGEGNSKITPIRREFGGRRFEGQRVTANIAGSKIIQDALAIPAPNGQWRLLVLQDVAPEVTPKLTEPRSVLRLLTETFDVKRSAR